MEFEERFVVPCLEAAFAAALLHGEYLYKCRSKTVFTTRKWPLDDQWVAMQMTSFELNGLPNVHRRP